MTKQALKNRIQSRINTKYHVKSYKAKHAWVFAGIFALLLGAGSVFTTQVQASSQNDNPPQQPQQDRDNLSQTRTLQVDTPQGQSPDQSSDKPQRQSQNQLSQGQSRDKPQRVTSVPGRPVRNITTPDHQQPRQQLLPLINEIESHQRPRQSRQRLPLVDFNSADSIPYHQLNVKNPIDNEATYNLSSDGHVLRIDDGTINDESGQGLNGLTSNPRQFTQLRHIYFGSNVKTPRNSSDLFNNLPNLTDITGSLDTRQTTNFSGMLSNDPQITNTDFASGWNTKHVTTTDNMFNGDDNLSNINGLSQWDMRNNTDLDHMFTDDRSLSDFTPVINNWSFYHRPSTNHTTDDTPQDFNYLTITRYAHPDSDGTDYSFTGLPIDHSGQATARFNYVNWIDDTPLGTSTVTGEKDAVLPESDLRLPSGTQLVDNADDISPYNDKRNYLPDLYLGNDNQSYTIPVLPSNITDYGYWGTAKYTLDNNGILNLYDGVLDPISYGDPQNSALGDDTGLDLNDVSAINTSFVQAPRDSSNLFGNLPNMTTFDGSGLDTSRAKSTRYMFNSDNDLSSVHGINNWDLHNDLDMDNMFVNCNTIPSLDLNHWNTSNVGDMSYMFSGDNDLHDLGIDHWNTGNVDDMSHMFYGLDDDNYIDLNGTGAGDDHSHTDLDLGNWNTSNVTNMSGMFENAQELHSLEMNNWDTRHVANMDNMFHDTNSLRSLSIGPHTKLYDVNSQGSPRLMGHWYNRDFDPVNLNADIHPVAGTYTETDNVVSRPVDYYFGKSQVGTGSVQVPQNRQDLADPNNFKNLPSGYQMDPLNRGLITLNSHGTPQVQLDKTGTWNTAHWDLNAAGRLYLYDGLIGSGDNGQGHPVLAQATGTAPSDITSLRFSNVIASPDATDLFRNLPNVRDIDMSGFHTNGISSTQGMFADDPKLNRFNDTDFNPDQDTDADSMFANDPSLNDLDLSNFDNSNILSNTTFNHAFAGDTGLSDLNLSNANVQGRADGMFSGDSRLSNLTLGHSDNFTNADAPGDWYNSSGSHININASHIPAGTYHTTASGSIPLTYVNMQGAIIGSGNFHGTVGASINTSSLSLPSGYHLANNQPATLTINSAGLNSAQVLRLQGNAAGPVSVSYYHQGRLVASHTFNGRVGDSSDLTDAMPSSYHLDPGEQSTVPFTSAPQNISVEISADDTVANNNDDNTPVVQPSDDTQDDNNDNTPSHSSAPRTHEDNQSDNFGPAGPGHFSNPSRHSRQQSAHSHPRDVSRRELDRLNSVPERHHYSRHEKLDRHLRHGFSVPRHRHNNLRYNVARHHLRYGFSAPRHRRYIVKYNRYRGSDLHNADLRRYGYTVTVKRTLRRYDSPRFTSRHYLGVYYPGLRLGVKRAVRFGRHIRLLLTDRSYISADRRNVRITRILPSVTRGQLYKSRHHEYGTHYFGIRNNFYNHLTRHQTKVGDWVLVKKPIYLHDSMHDWFTRSRLYRIKPQTHLYMFHLRRYGRVTRFQLWGRQFVTARRDLVKLL